MCVRVAEDARAGEGAEGARIGGKMPSNAYARRIREGIFHPPKRYTQLYLNNGLGREYVAAEQIASERRAANRRDVASRALRY